MCACDISNSGDLGTEVRGGQHVREEVEEALQQMKSLIAAEEEEKRKK